MAERKTRITKASVKEFIDGVENAQRRKDSRVVMKMMREASGKRAQMWGPSIAVSYTHLTLPTIYSV